MVLRAFRRTLLSTCTIIVVRIARSYLVSVRLLAALSRNIDTAASIGTEIAEHLSLRTVVLVIPYPQIVSTDTVELTLPHCLYHGFKKLVQSTPLEGNTTVTFPMTPSTSFAAMFASAARKAKVHLDAMVQHTSSLMLVKAYGDV